MASSLHVPPGHSAPFRQEGTTSAAAKAAPVFQTVSYARSIQKVVVDPDAFRRRQATLKASSTRPAFNMESIRGSIDIALFSPKS